MKNNIFKRVLCAALCLCMLTGTLLTLTSCNEEEPPEEYTEGLVTVVKVVKDIPAGTVITGDMVRTEEVLESNAHINAIRSLSKVKGKVALQNMYVGELVFAAKLGEVPTEEEEPSRSLVVTEVIDISDDVTEALQTLIDENPGRTIEFPDGEYIISKPIVIPADPAKAVSLRLSDYAVIRASDDWEDAGAMIQFAAGEISDDGAANNFYINGGTIHGNDIAKTLCIENANNVFITNLNLTNTLLGLEVVKGTADIESVNIVGSDADKALGMLIGGEQCTFTNVRISGVYNGVKITGKDNVLKSVQAVCLDNSRGSCGYYDLGNNNIYDMCFSEQFTEGFKMGPDTISNYNSCAVKWNSNGNRKHCAFVAEKAFNSVIRNCKVEFDFAGCNANFLAVGEDGGKGQIVYPIIGGQQNMTSKVFRDYLANYTDDEDPVIYIK